MSPKNLENLSNFQGWDLMLLLIKKQMQIFQEEVDIWGNWNRVTFFKTENKKRVLALSILFNSIDNALFRAAHEWGSGGQKEPPP